MTHDGGMALEQYDQDGTTMKPYRRVGRSLQATRNFSVGDVVLKDNPILQWSAETVAWGGCARGVSTGDLLKARQNDCDTVLNVPTFFLAAAAAFCAETTSEAARRLVLDMHVPDLPLLASLLDVALVCERLAERLDPPQAFASTALLHAMLAAKVNAHRGADNAWRLYPRGSKLAHSCAPNCAYQPHAHEFVAIRPIAAGELVTFSYVGGPMLLLPADLRQERLVASHLFLCQCFRCRGADVARPLPCPRCRNKGCLVRCTSSLIDSDHDLFPTMPWSCRVCQATVCDGEDDVVSLKAIEASIWPTLRDVGEPGHPYRLPILHKLLHDVASTLGRDHWMYAVCAGHVARYFSQLGRATRDAGLLGLGTQWMSAQVLLQWRILGDPAGANTHMVVTGTLTSAAEQMHMLQLMGQQDHLSAAAVPGVAATQRAAALHILRLALGATLNDGASSFVDVANAMRSGLAERSQMEGRRVDQLAALVAELREERDAPLPDRCVSSVDEMMTSNGKGTENADRSIDGDMWSGIFAGLEQRMTEVLVKFTQAAEEVR